MPLPILQSNNQATPETLVRLFHQTELNWARHLAEEQVLDLGIALFNPELSSVARANLILNASVPEGTPPSVAIAAAAAFYPEKGACLSAIIPSPSVAAGATQLLVDHLTACGWSAEPRNIFRLARRPAASPLQMLSGIKIIPARASFRHARQLAQEMAAGDSQYVDAMLLHLDDPHVDALLALRDGHAVGTIAVLAMGEVGRIDQFFVAERHRREGLGKLILSRALEICARALFKHILLSVSIDEGAAHALFGQFGFERIGRIELYRALSPHGPVASITN
jgi:GNAT superfamily N-acetyltransferase